MTRRKQITHNFVEHIPEVLEVGVVYISISYAIAVHLCCCGCNQEVVTPIAPNGWTLLFHGQSISLDPSIGNWKLDCQSHYWIRENRVIWASKWSKQRIEAVKIKEQIQLEQKYKTKTNLVKH